MASRSSDRPPSSQVEQWIVQAKQGSAAALGQALEACRTYLLMVANQQLDSALRGKVSPSDLAQETFLKAVPHFASFKDDTEEALLAWLCTILRHNLVDHIRRYWEADMRQVGREVPLDPLAHVLPGDSATGTALARAEEEKAQLERALEQLPEHYRRVIVWRNFERLWFEAIGQLLGRSEDAARKLWARAINQLQQLLDDPMQS